MPNVEGTPATMVDVETKRRRKPTAVKKRKLRSVEEEEASASEVPCMNLSEKKKSRGVAADPTGTIMKLENGHPWRNLQLILSLQNKDADIRKKVELAFDYVKFGGGEEGDVGNGASEAVSLPRLVVFLNNWVQSLLITSEKKIRAGGYKPHLEMVGTCLDHRCWEIFKFCLEKSLKLHVLLSFSRDLLRVIHCIARDALSRLSVVLPYAKETAFSGKEFDLYSIVVECVSLVFSSHGGVLNENLDLWILAMDTVLGLVQKFHGHGLDGGKAGLLVLQLSCVVLEPLARFLRIHPTRKNGFREFVDKLLEPLMHTLNVLHSYTHSSSAGWTWNLLNFTEQVLSHGLFHPAHMDGFLNLQSGAKYIACENGELSDSNITIKSYHRHLFDKLEKFLAGRNSLALGGVGEMFHLFVTCVKNQKGASIRGGLGLSENNFAIHLSKNSSENYNAVSQRGDCSVDLNAETRKSVFDFFVQIMEPLLRKLNIYLKAEMEIGSALLDVCSILNTTNKMLVCFMGERLYIRTEDTSGGALLNFLKLIYCMVVSVSTRIIQVWPSKFDTDKGANTGMLFTIAKELVLAVRYLVEIEYEVVGTDLESLWLMMFSFVALSLSLSDSPDQQTLFSEILHLGCHLVNLFSELREVHNVIFSLCKMARSLVSPNSPGAMISSKFMNSASSLCSEAYAKSVNMVLCSQEFRHAVYDAIVSIPEGQVSGCIQQLKTDISESLEWIRVDSSPFAETECRKLDPESSKLHFDIKAEILARGLSDIHTLVLDSLTVTAGNSGLVGVSVNDLMTILRLGSSNLVVFQSESVNGFLYTVAGRVHDDNRGGPKNDFISTHLVLLFFFRLYMSCRSIYQQALSLMPPNTSKKMSGVMGDLITGFSGKDWLERTDWTSGGYFSWILQPSTSLVAIIQGVSDVYSKETATDSASLIYVLNAMAIQRLVYLNRLIRSLEYQLQRNEYEVQTPLTGDAGSSTCRKNSKKLKGCILCLREEAEALTNLMMGHLSDYATCRSIDNQDPHQDETWDFNVGTLNGKSLPTALLWIVCQNIDIWCIHASKKKLKMFLSLLIQNSLLGIASNLGDSAKLKTDEPCHLKYITARQISLDLLRDTLFYEQRFVRRHMASRFCQILQKSVSAIFSNIGEVNLKSSPNWPEFLSVLENFSGNKHVMDDCTSVATLNWSSKMQHKKGGREQKSSDSHRGKFTDCEALLNFLCWMPKGCSSSKSLSLYTTYLINSERLVLGSLLDCCNDLCSQNLYDLWRLFLSCRRALKNLIMASSEETIVAGQSLLSLVFNQNPLAVMWLLKSLASVTVAQHHFSEDSAIVKDMIFSSVDHTSYLLLALSKYQFVHAFRVLINAEKAGGEKRRLTVAHEGDDLCELDSCFDSTNNINPWEAVVTLAETLKEETRTILLSQKKGPCGAKVQVGFSIFEIIKLSSIVSCWHGFLWGFSSALDHIDSKSCNIKKQLSKMNLESVDKLLCYIDLFAGFVNYFVHILVIEDDQLPSGLHEGWTLLMSDGSCGLLESESSNKCSIGAIEKLHDIESQNCETTMNSCSSSHNKDQPDGSVWRKFHSKNIDSMDSILSKCDSLEQCGLKKSLLQSFLSDKNREAAYFLRQLFIASAALLRLNLQINFFSLSLGLVPILIGVSHVLLTELVNKVEVPSPFSFVWLDGVTKFLEELGNHFPLTNPILSRDVYVKLVELHLITIGKCIALQGKRARLSSLVIESSTNTINGQMGSSESRVTCGSYCLDEFKSRLRMSFKAFVGKPLELHLLAAIQALERALVGVHIGCTINYEVCTGSSDGGKVSSIVAAGIDCVDLVLESVRGRKCLNVIRRHIQSIAASLFNIILHLQGPLIFDGNIICKGNADPDPGLVILMCVEVLTRVFGKHAIYQLDSSQVGQSLHIPAALFQNFLHFKISVAPGAPNSSGLLENQYTETMEGRTPCTVDRQFSIDLFAACCRLLSTVLKHHTRETEQFVALLEDSVSVLLYCLEMVDTALVGKCCFGWKIQEAVKCASFLQRIYEEMRHQRDVFGRHCSLFLSKYIWVYSGYGPLRIGIKREIDEALRPGVYALIDACSADDLQHLHTVFGEGPCRSTLATLRHDYKLNFQYEGKV